MHVGKVVLQQPSRHLGSMTSETRKALASIGSPDLFEALATDVLRAASPLYASLAHVGTNAAGRAVRSPVDGIGVAYAGGSRRLILTHHTITGLKALRAKWLDPIDGDIAKSLRIARAEKGRAAFCQASLVLTTPFEPGEDLIRDAQALAGDALQLDIWTGSRLAGFLDHDPEGQWLRSVYFKAEQARLSASKLKAICEESLNSYLPHDDRTLVVSRELDEKLAAFCGNVSGVCFVVGGSGLGKSTAVRRLGDREMERGGYALVIRNDTAEVAPSVEQAVAATLRSWSPGLNPSCGRDALALATPEHPILLVIEDINLSANPIQLVERILGWAVAGDEPGKPTVLRTWRVLAPVWQENVAVAGKVRDAIAARSFPVDKFERADAMAAIDVRATSAGRTLTRLQLDDLAARLGDDPLLIALNREWREPRAEDAIDSYIEQEVRTAAGAALLDLDVRDALEALAEQIVLKRRLDPSWAELKDWFGTNPVLLDGLRALLRHGHVIRFNASGAVERLAYRHDRVRDHLLSRAIERLIRRDAFPDDHWSDPYFAGLIGATLGRLDDAIIAKTGVLNPPALFAALADPRLSDSHLEQILRVAKAWVASDTFKANSTDEQKFHALRYLARTDAPFVRELAQVFPKSFPRLEAMIRNGDVRAAAAYCITSGPGTQNRWRDQLIDHALKRHPGFVVDLGHLIETVEGSADLLEGALNLAGEIGDPALCESLTQRWNREKADGSALTGGWLWAAIRCCAPAALPLADELCRLWAELPDKVRRKDSRDENPRWDIAGYTLPSGFRRKPEPRAIAYLIALTRRERRLQHVLGTILSQVDLPEAVVWSIEQSAKFARRCARTGMVNLFRIDAERAWDPDQHGLRLSEASRRAAHRIWRDRRRNAFTRRDAFAIWSQTPTPDEIASLGILEKDPVLADAALRVRLRAGDRTAIPLLKGRIASGKHRLYWWQHARRVGLSDLHDDVERFMEERRADPPKSLHADGDYLMSELLMDSRDEFSILTLKTNWEHLKTSPRYVQAALYTADPELVTLARAEIDSSENPEELLKHISMTWGFKTLGRPGVIELEQLKVLEPYYGRFGEMRVRDFFEAANHLGAVEWRKRHIDPHIAASRGVCAGTREALFAWLDSELEMATKHKARGFHIDYWIERREEDLDHSIDALRRFFGEVGGTPPEQICDALLERAGPDGYDDDVALLVLRIVDEDAQPRR